MTIKEIVMRRSTFIAVFGAIAAWNSAALRAEPTAAADQPTHNPSVAVRPVRRTEVASNSAAPFVRVSVTIVEFDEQDRAEIEKALGISAKLLQIGALDDKILKSLTERKLLRTASAPTIATSSGNTANVSYESGQGLDRQGNTKPITREIEITPIIDPRKQETILIDIRYRETTGAGPQRRVKEIDTGARLKPGETLLACRMPLGMKANTSDSVRDPGQLVLVKASIDPAKPTPKATFPSPTPTRAALKGGYVPVQVKD
ncbi:MAG TPA: hypothetical protein VN699_14900 [Pirellulales bacterium]|nr:hypothetical protein [Pirellulales bacterium]